MAGVDDIAAQLEAQIEEAAKRVEAFVKEREAALESLVKTHEGTMTAYEERIDKLLADDRAAAGEIRKLEERRKAEEAVLATMRGDLTKLEASTRAIPVELDAARAAEEAARAQLAQQRTEFEARESEVRYQLNELTKGVAFYKRLGLEFEKIHDDKLRLVFTLIDAAHPTRPFSFNVRVSEGDAYEVDSVEPPVAGVADLVRSLNATNNFSGFVQAMRAKFVALAASGGGAAAVAGGAGGW